MMNSPKNHKDSLNKPNSMIDAVEDSLVKKLELENEKQQLKKDVKDNYQIFERHFEDKNGPKDGKKG